MERLGMAKRAPARLSRVLVAASAIVLVSAVAALATPSKGIKRTDLAKGTTSDPIKIETQGPTDVSFRLVTVDPGGTSGWHSHPGPEVNVVKSGTVTFYYADNPTCSPKATTAGQVAFTAGERVHLAVNDASELAEAYVTTYFPQGSAPLKDEEKPVNCLR